MIVSENEEEVLTVKEVAEFLKMDESTIYDWLRTGKLPGRKLNNTTWRIFKSEFEAWLSRPGDTN